jgi:hypothetical protein
MKKFLFPFIFIVLIITSAGCNITDDDPGGSNPDYAERYLGTWHVYDTQQRLNYDVVIERDGGSHDRIKLNNFADLGGTAYAMVSEHTVIINNQEINNYQFEGTGLYENSNKLSFTYKLSDGIDEELRNAVFTK